MQQKTQKNTTRKTMENSKDPAVWDVFHLAISLIEHARFDMRRNHNNAGYDIGFYNYEDRRYLREMTLKAVAKERAYMEAAFMAGAASNGKDQKESFEEFYASYMLGEVEIT